MTPITIAGKEYPWPEGCKHFYVTNDYFWFRFGNQPALLNGKTHEKDKLEVAAAVAARHFENRAKTQYKFALSARDPHAAKHATEIGEMFERQAAQWEQLCHDL